MTAPFPDATHATFAKAMATQHAGPALKSRIDAAVAQKFLKKKKSLAGQVTSMRGAGAFRQPGGGVLKGVQARGGY